MTSSSTVVFAEMHWTPGVMVQAEDRAHRIGQTNPVNVYYLYGEMTLDTLIYPRLHLKSEVISNCLDGEEADFEIENTEKDDEWEEERKALREKKEKQKKIKKDESKNNSKRSTKLLAIAKIPISHRLIFLITIFRQVEKNLRHFKKSLVEFHCQVLQIILQIYLALSLKIFTV